MRLEHILGIGLWAFLFYIAIIRIVILQCTWDLFLSRLRTATPLIMAGILLSGLSGVVMGGSVGLIGNAIVGLLWSVWFFLLWMPQGHRQR